MVDAKTKQALAAKAPSTVPTVGGAPTPGAAAASTPALELAVQVGRFAEAAKAKQAAEQLQSEGFSPTIASQVGAGNHQISVVEVGPFSSWEQAAQVAHLIGRSLGTRPLIRPML